MEEASRVYRSSEGYERQKETFVGFYSAFGSRKSVALSRLGRFEARVSRKCVHCFEQCKGKRWKYLPLLTPNTSESLSKIF